MPTLNKDPMLTRVGQSLVESVNRHFPDNNLRWTPETRDAVARYAILTLSEPDEVMQRTEIPIDGEFSYRDFWYAMIRRAAYGDKSS
jgi:hypothetical protein